MSLFFAEQSFAYELSLKEKIGQTFLVGISGTSLTNEETSLLKMLKPGGVILFSRNIKDLTQLVRLNQSIIDIFSSLNLPEPFICLDQEGGRVYRVKFQPSLPSPLAVGKTDNPLIVEELSYESARILRSLGFNMNLSPVLDVLPEGQKSFIGDRSLGSSPDSVTKLGVAYALGHIRARVLPTAKHFPGSGHTQDDPHLVKTNTASGDFSQQELKPFRFFADLSPSAIMLSHIAYPGLDKKRGPATFSTQITSELLRKKWGYQGLIMTDDLLMAGAKLTSGVPQAAWQAHLAGSDLVMMTWSLKTQVSVFNYLLSQYQTHKEAQVELNFKVDRVLKSKQQVSRGQKLRMPAQEKTFIATKNLAKIENEILELNLKKEFSGFTSIKNKNLIVFHTYDDFKDRFSKAFKKNATFFKYSDMSLQKELIDNAFQNPKNYYLVPVTTNLIAKWVNTLPTSVKQRTLIIDLSYFPQLKKDSFLKVIQLHHPHTELPNRLAEILSD